ncbi:MAG: T9SS type A sorting domain-containing protein [Calditrichaeota bacterium]|nr:T9SS type A sorting domain-containing protein [Calditrichota bacterium]
MNRAPTHFFAASALAVLPVATALANLVIEPPFGNLIQFPDTRVGQTSTIVYTATDRGGGPWTINLSSNNNQFVVEPRQTFVPQGGQAQFRISFTPQQVGQVSGMLTGGISDGEVIQRVSVQMRGNGIEARQEALIATDWDSLEFFLWVDLFGSLWEETSLTLGIVNEGNAELVVQDIAPSVNWLTAQPRAVRVPAGEVREIQCEIPVESWEAMEVGLYRGNLTITSNAANAGRLVLPVIFDRGFVPHYRLILPEEPPASDHVLFVFDAGVGDEALDQYDEIAVWTPRGALAGVGWLEDEWPISFFAWGEGNGFPGFRQDEAFTFTIWDHDAEREFSAEAEWLDGPEVFEGGGISSLFLNGAEPAQEFRIPLARGWNLISLPIEFDERYLVGGLPNIVRIWAEIVGRENLLLSKDERGRFYNPRFGFSNIPYWNALEGYHAKLASPDTLVVYGWRLPGDAIVEAGQGWNMVSYLPQRAMRIDAALQDLTARNLLQIAKNGRGNFYIPAFGFGGDIIVNPGEGLMIRVVQDCQFQYPVDQLFGGGRIAVGAAEPKASLPHKTAMQHFPEPPQSGETNMSVLFLSLREVEVVEGAEIGVFTTENVYAGGIAIEGNGPWGFAAWGDDSYTEEVVEGFRAGEAMTFRYWDPRSDWELPMSVVSVEGRPVYEANGFLAIDGYVSVDETRLDLPTAFALSEVFPNPFNARASLAFDLPTQREVRLSLHDLTGRELAILARGRYLAGRHRVEFDASRLTTGVYLVRIEAGADRAVQRAVVMK